MGMSYSKQVFFENEVSLVIDFRKKVLKIREKRKLSIEETAKMFEIGTATIQRWLKKIEPCKTRNKPATKIDMETLKDDISRYSDSYNWERAKRLGVSTTCIFYALKRLKISYKKNSATSQGQRRRTATIYENN